MTLSIIEVSRALTLENAATIITLSHSKQPPRLRLFQALEAKISAHPCGSRNLVLDLFS